MYIRQKLISLIPGLLFLFLCISWPDMLMAEQPNQMPSAENPGSNVQSEQTDIQHLLNILKNHQKRQQLINRLESAQAAQATSSEKETVPDSLWEEITSAGQDTVEYIEYTFTSLPALLGLAKSLGISLILLVAGYIFWRLVRHYILPLVQFGWPVKILSGLVFGLAVTSGILSAWGLDIYSLASTSLGKTILSSLITILFVLIISYAAWEFINRMLSKQMNRMDMGQTRDRRLQTILPLFRSALLVVICVITILIVLSELGINIAPLLAGAGIAGLAIGFGAQTLVKDLLTGFFVLLENTINVGDWVILGGHDGQVEGLSIRHVMVRDIYGNLHTVPWSSVVSITNQTRDFGYAVVEVGFAYRENIDQVISVVKQVAEEMRQDSSINEGMLSELQILGLIELGDSSVVVRTRFKTQPFLRWRLERDFRRRIKNRFDELGIEIPYPHQTIYFGENKQGMASPARVQIQGPSKPDQG